MITIKFINEIYLKLFIKLFRVHLYFHKANNSIISMLYERGNVVSYRQMIMEERREGLTDGNVI